MSDAPAKSPRLYSLDILRGVTVAAMIIVNNAGGKLSYHSLQHSDWNGLTLCDMVFPTFLFIVGISTYISLSKLKFQWSSATFAKIVKRTFYIMLIGWAIHYLEHVCKADFLPFATMRLTGVLPRIALCYFMTSLAALTLSRRTIIAVIVGLLVVYSWIILSFNGYANDESNLLVRIDRFLLGENHLYLKRPVDPEGIASCISAIAHTLIGFCIAPIIFNKRPLEQRLLHLMVIGFALLRVGTAIEPLMPLNKRIWSPSFTIVTCALATLTLGLISFITDVNGRKKIFKPFDVFGVNPLFLYALSEVAAILISAFGAKPVIYDWISAIVPDPYAASAVYSVLFALVMWCAGYPLYKKKIYIKL